MNNIENPEERSLSPPIIKVHYERMPPLPTDEEMKVLRFSLRMAQEALSRHLINAIDVDPSYSYNHFISDMHDQGVPSEFANKALDAMRYTIADDTTLVSV